MTREQMIDEAVRRRVPIESLQQVESDLASGEYDWPATCGIVRREFWRIRNQTINVNTQRFT